MSMMGGRVPQGRDEVGQAVASFPTYEAAQKAVSTLIAAEIPARDIAIVGPGPALDRAGHRPPRLRRGCPLRRHQRPAPRPALLGDPRDRLAVGADPGVRRRAVRRHRHRHAAEHRHVLVRASPPGLRLGDAGRRRPLRGDDHRVSIHRARQVLGPQARRPGRRHPRPARRIPAPPDRDARCARAERPAEPPRYGERVVPTRMPRPKPRRLTPARLNRRSRAHGHRRRSRAGDATTASTDAEADRADASERPAARTATAHDGCRRFRRIAVALPTAAPRSRWTSSRRRRLGHVVAGARRGRRVPASVPPRLRRAPRRRWASRQCASTSPTSRPDDGCRDRRRTRSRRGRP